MHASFNGHGTSAEITETITLTQEQWSEVRIAIRLAADSTRDPQRKATRLALYELIVNQGASQATDRICQQMSTETKTYRATEGTHAEKQAAANATRHESREPAASAAYGRLYAEPTLVCGHMGNVPNCDACAAWRNAQPTATDNRLDAEYSQG